jgi:hypothetical protein
MSHAESHIEAPNEADVSEVAGDGGLTLIRVVGKVACRVCGPGQSMSGEKATS